MGFEIWKPEKLVIKFVWPYMNVASYQLSSAIARACETPNVTFWPHFFCWIYDSTTPLHRSSPPFQSSDCRLPWLARAWCYSAAFKGVDCVNSPRVMLPQSSIVAHAHLLVLHPAWSRGLTNQLAKKLLAISLASPAKARSQNNTESTESKTMTQAISFHKSSHLANCGLLHVSVQCCQIFVQSASPRS